MWLCFKNFQVLTVKSKGVTGRREMSIRQGGHS